VGRSLVRRWRAGNRVQLIENGDELFPRVFTAIDAARCEILLETFILFEDQVGCELRERLIAAARRGVRVKLTVDGYGSHGLSDAFVASMLAAGIGIQVFDPCPTLLGVRTGLFRRMHRKITVIDGVRAFIGGINFSAEHLTSSGPRAKQDYAVEIEGPVVADIVAFARASSRQRTRTAACAREAEPGSNAAATATEADDRRAAEVLFLVRDNTFHTRTIERQYRTAIRAARARLLIANAFFVPGYGLLRDVRNAARRGVEVTLVVQAKPEQKIAQIAARALYRYLAGSGVRIFEYRKRAFHGKVAVADDWATVGSTNFDPISLALNLEANVFIRDREFARLLQRRIEAIAGFDSVPVDAEALPPPSWRQALLAALLLRVLRRFHRWVALMPRHQPRLQPARAGESS
jgi:cardiolipin synthase